MELNINDANFTLIQTIFPIFLIFEYPGLKNNSRNVCILRHQTFELKSKISFE